MLNNEQFLRIVEATPLVSIDLVIHDGRGRVLLGLRRNRPAQHSWFVPGGRIWKNERVADALKRIARREIGALPEHTRLLGVFDHLYEDNFLGAPGVSTHYVVLGYEGRLEPGALITPDDQHGEMRWWTVEELLASAEVHENTKRYFPPAP